MLSKEYIDLYNLPNIPDFSYAALVGRKRNWYQIKWCDGFGSSIVARDIKGKLLLGFIIHYPESTFSNYMSGIFWQSLESIRPETCLFHRDDCVLCNKI